MEISREWAMPNKNTFNILPIREFVLKYLNKSKISIDPFARNFDGATYTNDLNPNTSAKYHMKAIDFLNMLLDQKIRADLIIFDPPYSLEQCKRSYESLDYKFTYEDTLYTINWKKEKNIIKNLLIKKGIFLHFGWHSNGMGMSRGFIINKILLVAHGGSHYDTICMAEEKTIQNRLKSFKL